MTVKTILSYSLLANAALAGAIVWQDQVREEALAHERDVARDQRVIFREHVMAELSGENPDSVEHVQALCMRELADLRPQMDHVWKP